MGKRSRLITDVKVKDIDDSARYLYPSRRIEIKIKGKTILTPNRAATSYEYNEKGKVPTDISIKNPITINVEHLTRPRFDKFLQTNNYYSRLLRKIELNNRLSQYSELYLPLFKPTSSSMQILKGDIKSLDRFLKFIIRLQIEVGLNPITIPYVELPLQTYKETSYEITKSLEKIDRQPLFFVDLKYDDFQSIIDWFTTELQLNAVGLYPKAYRLYPLNYDVLSRYVDKDVAFISAQIKRYDSRHYDISTMHYLPFFGNDIYAVEKPMAFGGGSRIGGRVIPQDNLRSIRIFDRNSLCVKQIRKSSDTIDDLLYEYRQEEEITNILNNYHEANTDDEKLKILRAFTKMSELLESSLEFNNLQDYVRQNSTNDYIQEKNELQKTLHEVTGSQTRLDTN